LSNERLQYVLEDVQADVTALTELHGNQVGRVCERVIVSDAPGPGDSAAGAAIVLSSRASRRVLASGAESSRVVWCRLEGMYFNQFIIGAYVAHKGRQAPNQQDVWNDIRKCARRAKKGDCLVLLGDMNGRLARGIPGSTGQFSMHAHCDAGGELMLDFMKDFEMRAVSTDFKPTKGSKYGNATYIAKNPALSPSQIDYILVSTRRSSCVTDSKVRWGPSQHRFGHKFDHGMVTADWKWRLRDVAPRKAPLNFKELENKESAASFDLRLMARIENKSALAQISESCSQKKSIVRNVQKTFRRCSAAPGGSE
jgi:hypothetical protein